MEDSNNPIQQLPLLPLRDIVVYPGMVAPLFVGRERSISALEDVVRNTKHILLVTQKDAATDDPKSDDLHSVGILASILQLLRLPDGTVKVLVEGLKRIHIHEVIDSDEYFTALGEVYEEVPTENDRELQVLSRSAVSQFQRYAKLNRKIAPEVTTSLAQIRDASKLADTIASHLSLDISAKQEILEFFDPTKRLERLYALMEDEIEVLNAEQKIRSRIKNQMEKTQKEYYLNEQLKAIHRELGDEDGNKDESSVFETKIQELKLTKEAKEKALSELKKLKSMAAMSAEATVTRNYLDWITAIPWSKRGKVKRDLKEATKVLDNDHYGLEKVKERILEYLAVQQRTQKLKGPVLCLVGPPGVGKTSLARSIADAVGRKFVKISLGGVRDEAEIRGHRRTYIGSMPGKVIQSMKKAEVSNPLFLLDEIDKIGQDFRGDPASALLEVLDPEQNKEFSDHYLEVDYDLSDVMFICTANSTNIPAALLDRLEIIRISGYTEDEKIQIAKRHLVPKQIENHGLKNKEFSLSDVAIRDLVRYYTREAGVRSLEREIANLSRKAIRKILTRKNTKSVPVTARNLAKYAGVKRFKYGIADETDQVGVVTGLAYTEVGGELLTIETVKFPGKGEIKCTGKLGDVMQESAQAAFTYARSRSVEYGIIPKDYRKYDYHIHVPEGATPKDGPSAGVALFTTIVSVMTHIPVSKAVAMTGEITLRGRILPIGGLKEKLLAALRGGIQTVLIPKDNEKDLEDIPQNVKKDLELIFVSHVDEVLNVALTRMPDPIDWQEPLDEITPAGAVANPTSQPEDVLKH